MADETFDRDVAYIRAQNEAFTQALEHLFKTYAQAATWSDSVRSERGVARRAAPIGAYRTYSIERLYDKAHSWRIPADQLLTIHTLIYG